MTGESELDSLDFCSGIIDEIALEGLDGITLQALWVRLKQRPNFSLTVDESSRPFIWNVVKCHPGLELYTFDVDRPQLVPFDRYLTLDEDFGVVVEPANLPVDPYPFEAVDDKERIVRGSCTTYYERTLVTDVVRGLSLAEVEAQYGDRLAAVASQRLRNLALVPSHIMDVDSELSLGQYLQMERIGRSRYHGEVTVGQQGLGVLLETPKNVYYIRKKLIEYRIITKQHFFLRLNTGKGSQGRLYHLPRFFTEFRPKYQLVIEHCVEELRRQPNHIMLVSKLITKFHKGPLLKKVAKFSDFQRFIKFESVPYRTLYPDASKAEWCVKNTGGERGVRIYRLLDPEVNVRRVLDEEEETEAEFQSAVRGQLKFPDQSRLSLVHSMERQAYLLLLSHGAGGMDSNVLRRELGMSQLDARALLKAIASVPGATFTYREDVGRIRITKYVASRFGHLNSDRHSMSMEESMLKRMANKSVALDTSTTSWDGADKPAAGAAASNDSWSGAPDADGGDAAVSDPIEVVERTPLAASEAVPRQAESADHANRSPRPKSKNAAADDAICPAESAARTAESKKLFQFSSSAKERGAGASPDTVSPPTTPAESKSEGEHLEGTTAAETSSVAGVVASKAGSSEEGAVATSAVATPKKHEQSEFYVVGDEWMLEVFDPSTGDRLTEQLNIPLEDTSLFSKSSSSRSMKRTRLVLEIVQRLKIVDHAFQLKRMVQSAEDEVMTPTKMDRRSFWRILKRLSDARLIRNYRLTLTKDAATHQSHMVADYSIGFDSELLSSCIEGVRIGFLLNLRGSTQYSGSSTAEAAAAAWEAAAGGQEDGSAGGTDGQSSPEKRLSAWSDSGVSGAKHQDRPHPDAVRSSAATSYQLTKFRRLHQLHEVLYYLGREYSGSEQLEQGPLIDALIARFPDVDRDQLPRIHNAEAAARLLATGKGAAASNGGRPVGWEMFMSPLPAHRGWGPGWMMLCDVLMRLPLCVFVRLVNVMYQTPLMARYIEHPLLCNLPVTHLPSEIVSCLRWKRKYMFSVHDDVSRLCFMGIIQFGQQLTSKDQVFLYLNRNASILDTVNSTEGFYTVNPDLQYPVKYYHFSTIQTLRDYWTDLKTISLSTPLGMRQQMEGKRMLVEEAFDKSLLQQAATERLPDQAEVMDTGAIPGDQLGAGGIDSALFTHMLRNWRDKFRDVVKLEESDSRKRRASAKEGADDSDGTTLRESLSKLRKQRASNKPSSHSSRSTLVQNLRSDGSKDDKDSADAVGAEEQVGTKRLRSPIGVATDGGVRVKRRRRLTTTGDAKRSSSTGSTATDKEAGGDAAAATSVGDPVVRGAVTVGSSGLTRPRRCRRSPANRLVKPRKRNPRPVIDDVDRRALQMLAKRRCCWSDRETAFLLLARVALQLISDSYKLPPGQYSTARDALHKYMPDSVDKTTMSVRRRICFALKNECNSAHASLLYQEYRVRDDVRAIIGDKPITQSRHNQDFVYPEKFNRLMKLLTNRAASDDNMGVPLPDDYATLSRECRFYEGDERLLGLRLSPVALDIENDVLKHTLTGFILSYLAAAEDKNPSTIVVYRTMSHYSEHLTQSAMLLLTRAEVVSRHKKSKMLNKRGSRATPFVDMSYSLSIRFRHRLITRYQYSVFAESYLWFKTLLLNSLTSELGCVSLQSVALGGQAAAIVSLVALDKLEYDITVPENIILMNDAQRKEAESGLLPSLDAADGDTSGGPTVSSVIVPAPSLRVSTSRVVLMSLRERQANTEQLALLDSTQTRANSHIYHEQLQVAPCEVSLRLRPPDQPPASSASASQDASSGDSRIAVDSSYIIVPPEKIKAVKERNGRLLDGVGPDREETLLRVSGEQSWSAEQLQDARQLLATLDRAGVMGVPASDAPTVSGLSREWLCQLVVVLSDCQLLLCVGRVVLRLVTRHNAQSWILHSYHLSRLNAEKLSTRIIDAQLARDFPGLDPVFFVPTPWRRVCGTLNRRVLDRLMGTVLGYCMEFPGKLMSEIQKHFHPCLTPCHTRLLLEELSVIGAVNLYEDSFEYAASLFSTREQISCQRRVMDLCSLPARVSVEPTVGALLRHSCFIGDKTYNQEFISEFGM